MGSRPSIIKKQADTSQYGKIFLQTDKTVYAPGDTVTGTIFLDLISHYPGNQLFLKFKGKEVAHVVQVYQRTIQTRNGPMTVYDYRKGSDKHKIINQSQVIHSWENLSPGQFNFPFSFLIPRFGIPGSFYQQGPYYLAFIEYRVEAFLQPFHNKDPKIKYKQPLRIKDTFFLNPRDLLVRETTVLKTCNCFNRGSSTLKAVFTKDSYSHGEKAEVLVTLENSNKKLEPDHIKFYLEQKLSIHAGGHHTYQFKKKLKVKQTFADKTVDPEMKARSLSLTLPPFATEADFRRKIDRENPGKGALMGLTEYNGGITCSVNGRFVNSRFNLRVKCSTTGCCTTSPKVEFPIFISPPDLKIPALPIPSNWQPECTENKIIEMSLPQVEAKKYTDDNDKHHSDKTTSNGATRMDISPMCRPELLPNKI